MTPLAQQIEAILFTTAEPQAYLTLARRFEVSVNEIAEAVNILATYMEGHALMVITHDETAVLTTRPDHSALLESMRKEELSKDLTKASAETLAIIVYSPGISKAQIEFIRGVNVSYTLRSLQMRGLIESKGSGRAVLYHPTLELLQSYGVDTIHALPQYKETKEKIDTLLQRQEETQ